MPLGRCGHWLHDPPPPRFIKVTAASDDVPLLLLTVSVKLRLAVSDALPEAAVSRSASSAV